MCLKFFCLMKESLRFGHVFRDFDFKVGTLNPKTFESLEFCFVNNFFSNLDIFLPVIL